MGGLFRDTKYAYAPTTPHLNWDFCFLTAMERDCLLEVVGEPLSDAARKALIAPFGYKESWADDRHPEGETPQDRNDHIEAARMATTSTSAVSTTMSSTTTSAKDVQDKITKERVLTRRVSGGSEGGPRRNLDTELDSVDNEAMAVTSDAHMAPELIPDMAESAACPPPWCAGAWTHIEKKMDMGNATVDKLFSR